MRTRGGAIHAPKDSLDVEHDSKSKRKGPKSGGAASTGRGQIARGEVAATFAQKVAGIRERLKLGETSPELVAVDWP